jgi:adenosylcobinamide kinase/adenosylcobinamide-phosphate guanylyltransferase
MGELILILGGARSGKSTFAQKLALEIGGESVLYLATAEAGDDEMRRRIEQHQQDRPLGWRTVEAQQQVGQAILGSDAGERAILVDCITLLVSNRLIAFEDAFAPQVKATVMGEVEDLVACAAQVRGTVITVSNEVGMGLVPPYPLGRAYRDLLGRANQALAAAADRVYFLVAGLPMTLKGAPPRHHE